MLLCASSRNTELSCRLYRRMSSFSDSAFQQSPGIIRILNDVDQWNFNIFELDEVSNGNALRHLGYQLIRSHGLISKLRV